MLFDHLVGAVQHRLGNRHADLFRGFEIDHKVELGRSFNWQVGWLDPFQNSIHIRGCAPILSIIIRAVAHQAAVVDKFATGVHPGEMALFGQGYNPLSKDVK